jgi:hypothetical protein
VARQLVIELVGKADKFTKTLGDAEKASASFGDKISSAGTKMTAFASVPIAGFLAMATKAAMDDADAQAHLAQTLSDTVGNSKALVTQVEGYITAAQKVSTFTDDELRPAFENLVRVTHNAEDANSLLTIAMDVAAAKHIDLATASQAVAKAHEGNFAAVNKLVPGLVDVKDKTLTAEQAMGQLASTFGGAAVAATETTAGKMQNLKRDLGEASESMGAKLLPAVTAFANFATGTLLPALDKLSGGNGAFVLLGVAAAGPALTAVTKLKDAILLLNGALETLAANPVVLFLVSLALALNDIQARFRQAGDEGFRFTNILKGIPGSGLSLLVGGAQKLGLLPGHAAGGQVTGPSIVGEKGPEVFIPNGSGTIIPNHALSGGGGGGGETIQLVVDGRVLAEVVRDRFLQKQRTTPLGFAG